jgi:hypothetical protein
MESVQNAKRIFLMGWNNTRPAFIKAALELEKRGYQILYWVAPYKEEIAKNKLQLKNTQFHWREDAVNVIPPLEINESEFAPPGEELIEKLFELESNLITMKKFYRQSSSMLAKKHLFHRLIQYWYGVINKFKPEIICFITYPHTVFDYTVYSLAKFFKIKTQMFVSTNIAGRWISISDFKQNSIMVHQEYLKNQNKQFKLKDLSPDIQEYYRWHLDNKTGRMQPGLKKLLKGLTGVNKLLLKFRVVMKSVYNLSFFKKLAGYIIKEIGPNMEKEYLALQATPDYSKKYIYLALNYQPEASTTPLGGVFADQILMIKMLSYCLPKGWTIYVKEHPFQWAVCSRAYFDFRYRGYYQEIARIKNVKLVPIKTNSHELIINSQAVGTVNSTAGLEALMRLKPVLLFGSVSYQYCPGVFKVKNTKACQGAIEKIASGFKISEQQIINYLISLDRVSYQLHFSRGRKEFPETIEENMSKIIVNTVIAEAEKNY